MKSEFSLQIFEKYTNINFNENTLSDSPAVPCGRTDMMKLIEAFRDCATAPKIGRNKSGSKTGCPLSTPLICKDYSVERLWQSKWKTHFRVIKIFWILCVCVRTCARVGVLLFLPKNS